jgi:type I restriction enzyme S subunit
LLDRPDAIERFEETFIALAVRGLLSPARADRMSAYDRDQLRREQGVEDVVSGGILEAEEMFVTPDTWRWRRIEDICSVQGGIQKTPLRRPVKHHFPYLRVANVQRDKLVLDQIEQYELTDEEVDTWRLRAGDLLVVEGNGSEDEIGRCAIWDGSIDPCVYQNHLIRVRAREAGFVEFLKLFLNSPSGISEMKRLAITTSGLYNLSVGKIRNIVVPVPPALEQQQIVGRVAELRRLCAALRGCLTSKLQVQERLSEAVVNSCGG